MEDFDSTTPVRAAIPGTAATSQASAPPTSSMAAIQAEIAAGATSEEQAESETTFPKELIEAAKKAGYEFWSPGMETSASSGYEEATSGQYGYGEQPFYMQ